MNLAELSEASFATQRETVLLLNQTYHFRLICIEKAGLSLQFVEELKREELPIKEFVPTIDNKAEAFMHLLKKLEYAKLAIPSRHQKLQV